MPVFLENITLSFPISESLFPSQLLQLLEPLGSREADQIEISRSNAWFLPRIELNFKGDGAETQTQFNLSDGEMLSVDLVNLTGVDKQHPKSYQFLTIETISYRLKHAGIRLTKIDHVGINLPWFGIGTHPQITGLRESLSSLCMYHRYPSGELWDFILPGDAAEITRQKSIDYGITRRPKFELVSFSIASTPLIQVDVETSGYYDSLNSIFPEALADPKFKNIWLYTENPYAIDVCLVLNEACDHDWSDFFKGYRL
jgi:hypothetical protein